MKSRINILISFERKSQDSVYYKNQISLFNVLCYQSAHLLPDIINVYTCSIDVSIVYYHNILTATGDVSRILTDVY